MPPALRRPSACAPPILTIAMRHTRINARVQSALAGPILVKAASTISETWPPGYAGRYWVYFANNLEMEPENAAAIILVVEYSD